jgi:hypothetical protein
MQKHCLVVLGLSLLLVGGTAHAQQAEPNLADPVTLFNTVCMGDRVKLPAKSFQQLSYAKLPKRAKDAFGFSLPRDGWPRIKPPFALSEREVPNQLLALLPKKDVFLLLPAAGSDGEAADQCAVIWRGAHYTDAVKAVDLVVPEPPPSLGRRARNLTYAVRHSKGVVVGAAELNKWTVLRVAPDLSPPQEPVTQ